MFLLTSPKCLTSLTFPISSLPVTSKFMGGRPPPPVYVLQCPPAAQTSPLWCRLLLLPFPFRHLSCFSHSIIKTSHSSVMWRHRNVLPMNETNYFLLQSFFSFVLHSCPTFTSIAPPSPHPSDINYGKFCHWMIVWQGWLKARSEMGTVNLQNTDAELHWFHILKSALVFRNNSLVVFLLISLFFVTNYSFLEGYFLSF
jgi:hypothetical protein